MKNNELTFAERMEKLELKWSKHFEDVETVSGKSVKHEAGGFLKLKFAKPRKAKPKRR